MLNALPVSDKAVCPVLSHFLVKQKSARTPTKLWVTTHICVNSTSRSLSSALIQPPGRPSQPGSTLSFFCFHTYCGLVHKSYLVAMVFSNPPHIAKKLSVLVSLLIQKNVVYPRSWGWETLQRLWGISPLSKGIQTLSAMNLKSQRAPKLLGKSNLFPKGLYFTK